MKNQTICLNMIVKNEAHCILDTLVNLCEHIKFSYWVISDTGSTDNTKEVITTFFKGKNIPGKIVDHQWLNFGYNRSKALESAYNLTDYLLIFDADDKLIGDFKLPELMHLDRYMLTFGGDGVSYVRPLLVNNRKKWEFKGVLHEALNNLEPINGEATIEGKYHVVSGRIGARSQNVNKYYDDAIILKKGFTDEFEKDYGQACRYAFYCGQSYKDAGDKYIDEAIEWYKKVLTLHNWAQEKFYSCFMIGDLYMRKNDGINALKYWLKSVEYDNERVEGVVNALNYLRLNENTLLVSLLYKKFANYKRSKDLQGKLFIVNPMFNDEIEFHYSICAFYAGELEEGYNCCKKILTNQILRYDYLKLTIVNTLFYKESLLKDTPANLLVLFYAVNTLLNTIGKNNDKFEAPYFELWNLLFEQCRSKFVKYNSKKIQRIKEKVEHIEQKQFKILLSFTTCKRYDLFQQTINSLINHCTDIEKVDYWFCVDDNTEESERQYMQKLYPWINYYMKKSEEKGHRESMNIIFNKLQELKPDYWIHLEDDFLFYDKMNYIGDSIQLLTELKDQNVGQILFNRNYSETINCYNILGHLTPVKQTNQLEYVLHDYKLGPFPYSNCHYWPHYSFRPSLIKVDTILKLGNYDSPNQFFEMDYAHKWTSAGHKSAFFNKITNKHIGRLTSERNDSSKSNAYTLNEEGQFAKKEKLDTPMISPPSYKSIQIVNLKRRLDRKEQTIKVLNDAQIDEKMYEFIEAVDGQNLEPTAELAALFKDNDFGSRRGFIGCALSHYNLWKQLINDSNNEYYVIMEDDFSVCSQFKEKYMAMEGQHVFNKEELLFLGYHMYSKEREKVKDLYNNNTSIIGIAPLNKTLYIGATFMYSINKIGAAKLLKYIEQNGIKHGIDYLIKICPELQSREMRPQLAFSEWVETPGQSVDTDIQNDSIGLDFSKIVQSNVKIFYHITCINNWKEIVAQQLNKINTSGLYNVVKSIHCFLICGDKNMNKEYSEYIKSFGSKIKIELIEESGNELITLSNINRFIETNDKFLYIHSKGVSIYNEPFYNNIVDWRNLMERFLINKYELCIDHLNDYDTVGINYCEIPQHYSGNFWWSTYKYFITLPTTHDTEGLLFLNKPKYITLYQSGLQGYGHYTSAYPESFIDKYIFLPKLDHSGDDISCTKLNLYDSILFADKDPDCIGFNTLGFFKNKIDVNNLVPLNEWGENHGIFIKKDYYDNNRIKPKYCFIHSCHILKIGLTSLNSIVNDLINSKLIDQLEQVFINNIGAPIDVNLYNNSKIKINNYSVDISLYEIPTINEIHTFCKNNNNCDILYLHTKGINHQQNAHTFNCVIDWFNMMKYFTIYQYEKCFSLLKNYDAVGCNKHDSTAHLHFSGNIWWATSNYIQTLNKITSTVEHDAEWWILSNKNVKSETLHNSEVNHYYQLYPKVLYAKDTFKPNFKPSPISNPDAITMIIKETEKIETTNINKLIQIKMLCNWTSSEQLCKEWSNMCTDPNTYIWSDKNNKQIQLTWTNKRKEIDYYVIINSTNEYFDPKKTIVFQMEPWVIDSSKNWGVKTWGEWAEPDPNKFLAVKGRKTDTHNNAFWQLELNHNELLIVPEKDLNKSTTISSICSSKYFDEGHIARIDLLKFLENKRDIELSIYNYTNDHNFKNYKGPLTPYVDKSKGILPYKYYFMVENNYEKDFITEKIWEPILCETLVFYFGCPNVHEYIDPQAYVLLPINDFEECYQIMMTAIKEDWWSQRIDIIRREKYRILNELGFFPTINKIINPIPSIPGIILIISCHKYLNSRVKDFKLSKTEYSGWKVVTVIGDPNLNTEYIYDITEQLLTVKCEDTYVHLIKKVILSMKILLSMYTITEGILRCGDDIEMNESKMEQFLLSTDKTDYMGWCPYKHPDESVKKYYNNMMPLHYVNHPEQLKDINMTAEEILKINEIPATLFNVGVIVYFSLKSCQCLINEIENVDWNIFHYDETYGYIYSVEDVGIGCLLYQNKIFPTMRNFYTFSETLRLGYTDETHVMGNHTNKYRDD